MSTFKVSLNKLHDHVLYSDKIVNITTLKEFDNITDALKDINNGIAMLLTYLDISFEIEGKGCIKMEELDCDKHSIRAIYGYLSYLSGMGANIRTYLTLTNFINDICYNDNKKILEILMAIVQLVED